MLAAAEEPAGGHLVGHLAHTGSSSSVVEPVAAAVPSVAATGAESVTVNVSPGSTSVSPATSTMTDFAVSPGANVSVPAAAA